MAVGLDFLKRLVVGRPLSSAGLAEQRLSKPIALAVFSSDALSSTAYASEEILFVTALGGSSLALGLSKLVPIAVIVAVLLAVVIASYRQVIFAYPNGGGGYVVSRENLGELPSLVAGASLMVDYTLTVAVSISAGVAAIISIPAFADLADHRVALALALITLITLLNMRGVKESGQIFAIPTYIYMFVLSALILYGLARSYFGDAGTIPFNAEEFEGTRQSGGTLGLFLLAKGFSSGAVALTGVEAISNGVPAFRKPQPKNAATTLVWMGIVLGTLFFGVSLLSSRFEPFPNHDRTVIAQLGLAVFGNGPIFLLLQFATAAILVLAANTAYNGFPGVASIIARDGYLPRQLANRGDRLVFSNGILVLAIGAAALIVAFGGITTALIPLYAIGVFTSFTLSQAGMVRHHLRLRETGWRRGILVNAIGGLATFAVFLIVSITKFRDGAWLPIVVIPAIVVLFKAIHHHYVGVAASLRVPPDYRAPRRRHTVVVLAGRLHVGVFEAVAYARSVAPDRIIAMSVASSDEQAEKLEKEWSESQITVPLVIVEAPHEDFTDASLIYIDELLRTSPNTIVTVLVPELYVEHWWQQVLHNRSTLRLKGRLLFRKGIVVTSLPYRLDDAPEPPGDTPQPGVKSSEP